MIEPFTECPRYEKGCDVNKCPLHPNYEKLEAHPKDLQQKCKVSKKIRLRIGLKYGLSHKGLFPREIYWLNQKNSVIMPSNEVSHNYTQENQQKTSNSGIIGDKGND